jgi:hypothetical protein
MITKMKKLTFLVYYKEYEAFLNGVRDLGVVHVAEKQQGVADNTELQDSIRLSARLQATEKLLQAFKLARPAGGGKPPPAGPRPGGGETPRLGSPRTGSAERSGRVASRKE